MNHHPSTYDDTKNGEALLIKSGKFQADMNTTFLAIAISMIPLCLTLTARITVPKYTIYHIYNAPMTHGLPIHHVLTRLDDINFPSNSQAKRAVEFGRILVLSSDVYVKNIAAAGCTNDDDCILKLSAIINTTTTILGQNEMIVVRGRLPNEYYPQYLTKYVDPPSFFSAMIRGNEYPVLYEDDWIAIVNKLEGIDTIGQKRNDLQSVLPFILRPPSTNGEKEINNYLPRPIHRLDRGTSGCVLVAKSKESMKYYSRMFAMRKIEKAYYAIVFGQPSITQHNAQGGYYSINYPIDGKEAISSWKIITTVTSPIWGKLSLIHVIPKTGRYHQIRRHLSYCLSCPIVGDSKYDGGGKLAKMSRQLGFFLCSNSIHLESAMGENGSNISVSIPLPEKFYRILGLSRDHINLQLPIATSLL